MFRAKDKVISSAKIWFIASRPKTLSAGIVPVFVGGAMSYTCEFFHWSLFLLCAVCALGIQILTNLANDYFDCIKGADADERVGPIRVTQAGLVSLHGMRKALLIVSAIVVAFGTYLVVLGGLPILIIGVLSMAFAFLYTGGPFPLAYLGLGDLFVFVFFGPVAVGGTYFLMCGRMPGAAVFWIGAAIGAISTAILVVNNLRDIETDAGAGKKTLAVRLGSRFARVEYTLLLFFAALVPWILVGLYDAPRLVLLSSGYIVFALPLIKKVWNSDGAILNTLLAKTGLLLVLFGVLFSLAWLCS